MTSAIASLVGELFFEMEENLPSTRGILYESVFEYLKTSNAMQGVRFVLDRASAHKDGWHSIPGRGDVLTRERLTALGLIYPEDPMSKKYKIAKTDFGWLKMGEAVNKFIREELQTFGYLDMDYAHRRLGDLYGLSPNWIDAMIVVDGSCYFTSYGENAPDKTVHCILRSKDMTLSDRSTSVYTAVTPSGSVRIERRLVSSGSWGGGR